MSANEALKRKVAEAVIAKNKNSQSWVDCYPQDISANVGVPPEQLAELMYSMIGDRMLRGNGKGGYILSEQLEFERLDQIDVHTLKTSDADYLRKAVTDAIRYVRRRAVNLAGGDSLSYFLDGNNQVQFLVMIMLGSVKKGSADLSDAMKSLSYDELVKEIVGLILWSRDKA